VAMLFMVMNGYKLLIMVISGNCSNPPFINIYLVGGLEHEFYDFPTLGIVTPTDELIFFRGAGIPPTSVT